MLQVDRADRPRARRRARLPPDGRRTPSSHFPQIAEAGGDSVTFHVEVVDDPAALIAQAREHGLGVGRRVQPGDAVADARRGRAGRRPRPLHEHPSRLLGPGVHAGGARPRSASCATLLPDEVLIQVDGGVDAENVRERARGGREPARRGQRASSARGHRRAPTASSSRAGRVSEHLERALELAERGRGTTRPNPVVGAVVVARRRGRRRGLARARGRAARRGRRARGGGRARARRDALRDARAVRAPRPHAALRRRARRGRGRARRRRRARPEPEDERRGARRGSARPGSRSSSPSGELEWRARVQNEAFRTWVARGPAVRDLQGGGRRSTAGVDACRGDALGLGRGEPAARPRAARAPRTPSRSGWAPCAPTTRGSTRATSTRVRQPRRLAFGRGPLPEGSELELLAGPLEDELRAPRRGGRAVAAPRGRADARRRVPRGGPRRQAAALRRADVSGAGARLARPTLRASCRTVRASPRAGPRRRPVTRPARPSATLVARRGLASRTRACSAADAVAEPRAPESSARRARAAERRPADARGASLRRVRCSPGSSASSGEVGASTAARAARPSATTRAEPRRGRRVGDSVAVNGVCLTAIAVARRRARLRRHARDAAPHVARRPRGRATRSTSSRRCAPASRSAATRPGPRRRRRPRSRGRAGGRRRARRGSTRRPELLRYCVEKGSIAVDGRQPDGRRARRRAGSRSR